MNFTPEQAQRYYETRMEGLGKSIRRSGASWMAKCCFHDDSEPSMSFNFEKGVWHCHTEHIGGGMLDFEMRLNGQTHIIAMAAINSVLGLANAPLTFSKPEAIYEYRDEQGRLLYQVVRSRNEQGKKRISNRRPVGKNGWEYSLEGTRRVLYHLDEVMRSTEIMIVEGEKCADAVRTAYAEMMGEADACLAHGLTATTNPHGAGKWREDFAVYFAGKKVVVVPDNDAPGREHMEMVAASVSRYALGVKWLDLPSVSEKDDVADYLENNSFGDLRTLAAAAPMWKRKGLTGYFVPARDFVRYVPELINWRVDRIIEKDTSGFIIALPKSGKSFATVPLAVALACGGVWLEFNVPEPTRVALVSREDAAGLTARRLKRAILGMGKDLNDPLFETNLLINTRQQTDSLMLDDDAQLAELIQNLKDHKTEFCILDVLNVLHDADENDNSEMRRVLTRVSQIRKEVGCQICIVHHSVKDWDDTKTLSQLARGSSAISGFAEFIIGIRMVDEEAKVRQMRFETKSDEAAPALFWKIADKIATGGVALERIHNYEQSKTRSRRRVEGLTG